MAIGVDQNSDNELWRVSVLTKVVIFFFNLRRIDVLKNAFINETIMVFGKQVENVGWEQQMLVKLNRAVLEFWWW